MTNVWLGMWSDDMGANYTSWTQSEVDRHRNVRLGVYGVLGCGQGKHGVYEALGCGQGEQEVYRALGCGQCEISTWECMGHWDVDNVRC